MNIPLIRLAIVLSIVVTTSNCTTPKEWSGGKIPPGQSLSNSERMEQHSKFVMEDFGGDIVLIREKDEVTRYTIESYKPVMDQLDPNMYRQWRDHKPYSSWAIVAAAVSGGAAGYAATENRPDHKRYTAAAVAVIAALAGRYLGEKVDVVNKSIKKVFNTELEIRLFGLNDKQ